MVPHPFPTIAGGMTPGMLGELAEGKGREDGFSARLLFCYPDRASRPYSEEGIPEGVAEAWRDLARALWDRPMRDLAGQAAPHVVKMTPEARREWARWCQAHRDEQEADDFPGSLEGTWGKLEAYAARLALILHLMDLAADPTRPADDEPRELPRRAIDDAARLVDYFKSHARRVRVATGGKADDGGEDVRALLGWIVRNDLAEFSIRDIDRNFDRFKLDPAARTDALEWIGRTTSSAGPSQRTRPPSPAASRRPATKRIPDSGNHRVSDNSDRMGPSPGVPSETSETRCFPRGSNDHKGDSAVGSTGKPSATGSTWPPSQPNYSAGNRGVKAVDSFGYAPSMMTTPRPSWWTPTEAAGNATLAAIGWGCRRTWSSCAREWTSPRLWPT